MASEPNQAAATTVTTASGRRPRATAPGVSSSSVAMRLLLCRGPSDPLDQAILWTRSGFIVGGRHDGGSTLAVTALVSRGAPDLVSWRPPAPPRASPQPRTSWLVLFSRRGTSAGPWRSCPLIIGHGHEMVRPGPPAPCHALSVRVTRAHRRGWPDPAPRSKHRARPEDQPPPPPTASVQPTSQHPR